MERKVVRLGRREGVAGSSPVWEIRIRGAVREMDRATLKKGLMEGWLTGIEAVRRTDGDWGPLFGRPIYREVFQGTHEPRDHAKARARARADLWQRSSWWALGVAAVCFLGSMPWLVGPLVMQMALLGTLVAGLAAGVFRLLAAVQRRELDDLTDQLVPKELPPPEPVDWALKAAEDEVAAVLMCGSDGAFPPTRPQTSPEDQPEP